MNLFQLLDSASGAEQTPQPLWMTILMFGGIIVVFYFLMIRPQSKEKKKQKEMIASMEVGDGVTTIGGVIGRIVSIKDDVVLIETSADRTKIRFQKGAIAEVEKLALDD